MLSIGMIALLILSLITNSISDYKKAFAERKWFILILIFVIPYLLGGLYSENIVLWWKVLVMKAPFIALPIALVVNNERFKLDKNDYFINILLAIFLFTSFPIFFEFINSYDDILMKYSKGKTLSTPINHIRYSLMLGFGVLLAMDSSLNSIHKGVDVNVVYKFTVCVILFVTVHLLAVRSGLLSLYIGLVVYLAIYIYKKKSFSIGLLVILFFAGFVYLSPKLFPTINKKIGYTLYSLEKLKQNKVENYSDTKRLVSMDIGWKMFSKNYLFGVGPGDLKKEVSLLYDHYYPNIDNEMRLLPHNQFLRIGASVGIIGLCIFLLILIFPLWHISASENSLFFAFMLSSISSFFVEGTIETQRGTAYFLLIMIILYNNTKTLK
jgi:O-antigen ligase